MAKRDKKKEAAKAIAKMELKKKLKAGVLSKEDHKVLDEAEQSDRKPSFSSGLRDREREANKKAGKDREDIGSFSKRLNIAKDLEKSDSTDKLGEKGKMNKKALEKALLKRGKKKKKK